MEKEILVTGAGGFIGRFLVEALLLRGDKVRCLVGWQGDADNLKDLPVETVWGDLRDKGSLIKAVKGAGTVYHLAALVNPSKTLYCQEKLTALYYEINVKGTENLVEICKEEKIKKFIYFSSVSAAGLGAVLHEDSPCNPGTDYGRSKLEAEKLLLRYFQDKEFPVVIIRPGSVYGPGSMSWLAVFKQVKKGIVPFVGKGYNSTPVSYIGNLIKASLLIAEKGRPGEIYFAVDDPCTLDEFVQSIADVMQVRVLKLHLPRCVVFAVACLKEALEKMLRLRFYPFGMDFGIFAVRRATSDWICSNEKIKKIGYLPDGDLRQAVSSAFQWYVRERLL